MSEIYSVKDINLAPKGDQFINWVSTKMPVLNGLYEKFKTTGAFKNKKVALCIHLEAKTAYPFPAKLSTVSSIFSSR